MKAFAIPELAGVLEFFFRPQTRESWGGPFNGQVQRFKQVRDIFEQIRPDVVIETGTYRATSTIALAGLTQAPVYTIEASRKQWGYSMARLLLRRQVTLLKGDSRRHIAALAASLATEKLVPFFYLDAHWGSDLPLAEELSLIFSPPWDPVVMVDDFKVDGDPGYTYDDYGPGKTLDLDYISPAVTQFGLQVYFPSAAAANETGMKRGAVVLARNGRVAQELARLDCLRKRSNAGCA
jgi:hypothetical protein